MSDHQKIHPVDVEAPRASAPLVPANAAKSDRGDPAEQYVPLRRTIPVYHSKPPHKKRGCCCKFICWTISLLLLLVILIAAAGGILYVVFRPKLPKYSIDRLRIVDLKLNDDMSLYAKFDVTITSENPNKNIGIYYENGSHLSVYYTKTKLCEGSLPKFYQGHRNTTVLNVGLTGQNNNGSTLLSAISQQQQTGNVPLDLRIKVPVRIKLGKLKLVKVKFLGKCKLVLDNLSANNLIRIRTSSCKFRVRL